MGVGVVAFVAEQCVWSSAGPAGSARDGGMPSIRARVWVTSLTLAAVVMTLSGVPRPSQIRWCLLPVFRRSTGDGPVSTPPFSRGCGNRPHTHVTSRVRRPRSALRAGPGATGRSPLPSATGPAGASRSVPSRTRAPGAGVARLCRCRGRTGCPGGRADPTPASAPATAPARAAATARPEPTTHRPRSTVGYPHPHERPNHHTGNGLPGRFRKIVLRALRLEHPHHGRPCRYGSTKDRYERRLHVQRDTASRASRVRAALGSVSRGHGRLLAVQTNLVGVHPERAPTEEWA